MRILFSVAAVLTIFALNNVHAQKLDSLILLFESSKKDSIKFIHALEIGDYLQERDIQRSTLYLEKARLIWEKQIKKTVGNPKYIAKSKLELNLLFSNSYAYQGFLDESSNLLFESLDIAKNFEIEGYESSIYANLGNHMLLQGLDSIALKYFEESLLYALDDKKQNEIGLAYGSIGSFWSKYNTDSSIYYFQKSVTSLIDLIDSEKKNGALAWVYENIGRNFLSKNNTDSALYYFEKSLVLREKINHKLGMNNILNTMANVKIQTHFLDEANDYVYRSIQVGEEAGLSKFIYNSYFIRSYISELKGDYNKALLDYKTGSLYKDSLISLENQGLILRKELEYKHKEEKFEDSLKNANALQLKNLEISKQKNKIRADQTLRYSLLIGVCLLLIVFLVTLRAYFAKKERNRIIKQQKSELEYKNGEILSSINYAKRIQKAILPPLNCMDNSFEDCFIYYQPKDIVAGDFYWYKEIGEQTMWAVGDCTGHGVPGAILSMMCYQALDRCVRDYGLSWPDSILNKARSIIIEELGNANVNTEVQDGMDIAFCIVKGMTLNYSGAYRPLWLFRNGELTIINGDKNPVGSHLSTSPFTDHEISLKMGDAIYIFSDGYVDQFGGTRGKKFKPQKFKELLTKIQDKDMDQQQKIINQTFIDWKGEIDQVDDICIIGVKI